MAKHPYLHLIRQFLAWLLFFQLCRLVFVVFNYGEISHLPTSELLRLPWESLYLDVATACYFMGLPLLLVAAAVFSEKTVFLRINRVFTSVLVVVVSAITIAELPIYDEWHTKLNYRAICYLATPTEVFRTATTSQLLGGVMGIVALAWAGVFMFKKLAYREVQPRRKPLVGNLLACLCLAASLTIGLRGGLQQIPIQVSDAYYSKHNILNLAATNSSFNLISSCLKNRNADKPYHFMPEAVADSLFQALQTVPVDTSIQLLTTKRPNIVLVILESWSADLVGACGGYAGITPTFDSLARQGYLFKNCYASGERSDQGMAAIFSAFPAQPKTSIIKEPDKYVHLPCINQELEAQGYHSSFLFGGQLSYENIRSYMFYNGFDRILEGKDFDSSIPQAKLGVHDEYLFERQLDELSNEEEPFFAAMFTLSSHSPYDVPMKPVLDWGGKDNKYINGVYYTDKCIHDFMEKAKQQAWYQNTLFVFMADHGHPSPRNWSLYQPEYRRMPFLLYGEVIRPAFRGIVDSLACSQTDFVTTLLRQMGISPERYKYSKNLLNPLSPRYAYFSFDEGFCLVKPSSQVCWHVQGDRKEFEKGQTDEEKAELLEQGKAFLEVLLRDYLQEK